MTELPSCDGHDPRDRRTPLPTRLCGSGASCPRRRRQTVAGRPSPVGDAIGAALPAVAIDASRMSAGPVRPGRTAVYSTARTPTRDEPLTPHVVAALEPKSLCHHQRPCRMRCTNITAFGARDAFHRWIHPGPTPRWRLETERDGRHELTTLPSRDTLPTRAHAYEYALDRTLHRGMRGAIRPRAAHRLLLPKRFSNTPAMRQRPRVDPEGSASNEPKGSPARLRQLRGWALYRESRSDCLDDRSSLQLLPQPDWPGHLLSRATAHDELD